MAHVSNPQALRTFADLIDRHPVIERWLAHADVRARETFTGYGGLSVRDKLLLVPFVTKRPHKFFNRACLESARQVLAYLTPSQLNQNVNERVAAALRTLWRSNEQGVEADESRAHDKDDPLLEHRLRDEVLPLYSYLAEHAYDGLLTLLLDVELRRSGSTKNVGTQFRSRWDQARKLLTPCLSSAYHPTIRNAIVHGGVTISGHRIHFQDASDSQAMDVRDAEELAAKLLDVCNGIATALLEAIVTTNAALTGALSEWERMARVLATTQTLQLHPTACFISEWQAGALQLELHGTHRHWSLDQALSEIARAFVAAKAVHVTAKRFFLSFVGDRGARCFFTIDAADIPQLTDPLTELQAFGQRIGGNGLAIIEHDSSVRSFAGHVPVLRTALPWLDAADISQGGAVDFLLRHVRDVSVGRRLRFEASVISRPAPKDLEPDGWPTAIYLQNVLLASLGRFVVRRLGPRPLGANRLRIPRSATISVYCEDQRRLTSSGLRPNFLFRFQRSIGRGPLITIYGGSVRDIDGFTVCVNPAAEPVLKDIKAGKPPDRARLEL